MIIIKKFIIIVLEIIILIGVTTHISKAKNDESPFFIYIDPGHGGFDGGTTNSNSDIIEKDITLEISLLLASKLRQSGYVVKLTREKDIALSKIKRDDIYKRVDLINESKATIYISIHANSYPHQAVHGAQVFYNANNENNKKLASLIMNNLKIIDSTNTRDIHSIKDKYLMDHVLVPGCLVEVGFLSNSYDLNNLTNATYQNNLCEMIYLGITEYLDYLK